MDLQLVATCALGLEEILEQELLGLGVAEPRRERGAVTFLGSWEDCWRANWRLRTANRVLIELGRFPGEDGKALAAGARRLVTAKRGGSGRDSGFDRPSGSGRESGFGHGSGSGAGRGASGGHGSGSRAGPSSSSGLDVGDLLRPDRSFALHATATGSQVRDTRWAVLTVKDGLVDGQRERWGRRSDVERADPDLHLRLRLHRDEATLLLDTSGEPLDRRGYREQSTEAPLREHLAAACVLASGWDGKGPVVDPMCGSGTLLVEAGWIALGRAPGHLRQRWAFERLPGFEAAAFAAIRDKPIPAPGPDVRLLGNDRDAASVRAARTNLERAGLADCAIVKRGEAQALEPPPGPGLVLVNPPHGERLEEDPEQWRALGDLLKKRYAGWRAAVLAGGESRGKWIGLRPERRIPVMNGPLEARILVFALY